MKRLVLLLTIFIAALSALTIVSKAEVTPVAVIDFEGAGISASALTALSEIFRYELMGTGLYDVMDRTNMEEVLKEQGFQMSGACTDLGCMVQVGQILGVSKIFGGTIGQLGTKYVISVKMIDVETSHLEKMEMESYIGPLENMDIPVKNIVLKLLGKEPLKYEAVIPEINAIFKYEVEKKDYTKAMFYSLFPGGGHFYAKNNNIGIVFVISRLGSFFYLVGAYGNIDPSDTEQFLGYGIFPFISAIDIFTAPLSAKSYNKKLKQKYNISLHPMMDGRGNCGVAFTIDF